MYKKKTRWKKMRNRKRIIAWKLHIFNNQKTTSPPNVGSSVRKTEAMVVSYQSLQTTICGKTVFRLQHLAVFFTYSPLFVSNKRKPVVRHILQTVRQRGRVGGRGGEGRGRTGVMWCLKYHLDLWTCPWDCRQRTWNKDTHDTIQQLPRQIQQVIRGSHFKS